jgi:hypothetical protein
LEDFQLLFVKPDFITGETFIHRDDIVIAVGSGEHTASAVRTDVFLSSSGTYFFGQDGIVHEPPPEFFCFLDQSLRESDFLPGYDPFHKPCVYQLSPATGTGFDVNTFIEAVVE